MLKADAFQILSEIFGDLLIKLLRLFHETILFKSNSCIFGCFLTKIAAINLTLSIKTNLKRHIMNPFDTPSPIIQSNQHYPQLDQDNPLSPKGRFTRLSYLAWNAVIGLIFTFAFFVIVSIGFGGAFLAKSNGAEVLSHPLVIIAIILGIITYIALMVSMVCIMIRRLHDLNKSGWLWLLIFVPIVSLFFSIYIFVARGSKETNTYGAFRPTEISEKYLGLAYACFLGIFVVLYAVILSFWMMNPEKFTESILQSNSAMIADSESTTDEENMNNTEISSEVNSEDAITTEEATRQTTDTVDHVSR